MFVQYYLPALSIFIAFFVIWGLRSINQWIGSAAQADTKTYRAFFPFIRRWVYVVSTIWATVLYIYVANLGSSQVASLSLLMRLLGLTSMYLLFITLAPGLLGVYAPNLPTNALFVRARRAIGVSAFGFGLAHGALGFIYNLSANVTSIFFVSPRHQVALVCSFTAFVILTALFATSFNKVEAWMGPVWWKRLHRLIYLAALLVVFHAFLIGSHFTNPQNTLPKITNIVALTLILLEAGATWKRLVQQRRLKKWSGRGVAGMVGIVVILGFWSTLSIFQKPYDPHARHRAGYSKNYEAVIQTQPAVILPNEPFVMRIQIRDRRNGDMLTKFPIIQEKPMHLMVVSRDLAVYQHLHPEKENESTYRVEVTLPKESIYSLYIEYSAPDFAENVSVATLQTQNAPSNQKALLSQEVGTKVFGEHEITFTTSEKAVVQRTIDLTYSLKNATTGVPIADLEPYLGAFGHLAIISEDSGTFTHVHPLDIPLAQGAPGGPVVRFSTFFPKPGRYKLFAQFKRSGEVFLTDFVVRVP